MPAVVESMMYFGQTPWHGLGQQIEEDSIYDIQSCIEKSGLDWTVDTQPLVTVTSAQSMVDDMWKDRGNTRQKPSVVANVPNMAIVRSTDEHILGVVGSKYTCLQNRVAFDWFQPFLDTQECKLHTAGSLFDGQKIWVLAQLNKDNSIIAKDDEVSKFILLSNSHDGTTSVRIGFTPIRVVCANTMSMAHNSKASKLIKIRHSGKVSDKLDNIRDIMNLANQEFETTAEQYRYLASKQINTKDLEKYVKICMGIDNVPNDKIKVRTKNTMQRLIDRATSGQFQSMPSIRGTWWAAYNGINEHLNYEQGRNASNRLNALWFGKGVKDNHAALLNALELAG